MKLSIQRSSAIPIRDQLIEQIALQIASGSLKAGEKLSSVRALAQRLGIHYNTVSSAYNHLAEVGLLDIRAGSGVRVTGPDRHLEADAESDLQTMVRDFLATAAEQGYGKVELDAAWQQQLNAKSIDTILVLDRNRDFHGLLVAELQPHFKQKVQPVIPEEVSDASDLLSRSLLVTSLYHVITLRDLQVNPTRLVVCNVEPGRSEMESVAALPTGALVVLVSVSETLLKIATNLVAALRGQDIATRSILSSDVAELKYSLPYANMILCDRPSQAQVKELAGKVPVSTFHLYSNSTIDLIKERLQKWG